MTTPLKEQLSARQTDLITKISSAARVADTHSLLALNDELRQTVSLLARIDDIDAEARAILDFASAGTNESTRLATRVTVADKVPGRAHGVQIRSGFLERAAKAGLVLRHQRGAIYSSQSGRRIGIAVATERNPNRWFLGLGEDDFDAAVLLCAPESGKVIDLCLPQSFIAQHKHYFSRSGGQIKFNVARREGHMVVKVPTQPAEQVNHFIGAIVGLDR